MTNNCVAEKIQNRENWMYMEMQAYEQQPVIQERSVHIIKLSNEIRASLSDECAEKFDELRTKMFGRGFIPPFRNGRQNWRRTR